MQGLSITDGTFTAYADASVVYDLSRLVGTLSAFGAPSAQRTPLNVDNFIGSVSKGGSCNCSTLSMTPHCHGTHTESVAHILSDQSPASSSAPVSNSHLDIYHTAPRGLLIARLVAVKARTVSSEFGPTDQVIGKDCIQHALEDGLPYKAIILRTRPRGEPATTQYSGEPIPPYLDPGAAAWLVERGIEHLLVDLPSVDRMNDGGRLLAHRAFWMVPSSGPANKNRQHATITELIDVPDEAPDGAYILNLQVAPIIGDAAPSRPIVYPITRIKRATPAA